MPDEPREPLQPDLTERARAQKAARAEREAAALRENLRKRKAQSRARELPPDPPEPHD